MPHAPSEPRCDQRQRPPAAVAFAAVALWSMLVCAAGPARAAAVDGDRAAVLLADRATATAQRGDDRRALAAALDPRFTLTDATGAVIDKARFLAAAHNRAPGEDGADPQASIYGGLAAVTGSHRVPSIEADTRYLHLFVRKGGRWRAYAFFETAIKSAPAAVPPAGRVLPSPIPPGGGAGACDNPCRTIPYAPRNPAEAAVIDAYKGVELESVTGDVDAFARRLAGELLIVVPSFTGKPVTRDGAVASHQRMREQNIYYPPVPVTRASVAVFGTGALMVTRHDQPPDPAKSSILAQVWTQRDGRWQLALSQQVRIAP